MTLHAELRPEDLRRAVQAMTAWECGDAPALDLVLEEVANDEPDGTAGLVLGLLRYCSWVSQNTGALLGPDGDGRGDE